MAAQVAEVLARVCRVDRDRGAVDGGKVLAARREAALAAALDANLFDCLELLHQHRHQAQLVREADQHLEAGGVDGDRVDLVGEVLDELARAVDVVPQPHRPVGRHGRHQRLPDTNIHASDRPLVVARAHDVKVHLVRLHDLLVAEHERVELVVLERAQQELLARRDREVLDLARVVLNREGARAAVHLLLVLLKDGHHAVLLANHKAL
mmetsp:Transcript_36831/g.108615  ORF Transcript_36831/g.108615 Transcript_36831/m.108615 type:complete len:209 (+) Transcript_36831:3074-3700(+)